ncbi:DUF3592 domain-containing protein [Pseudanabaena sp. UWO311]|uniref:DUF3592 domain-containing protein n=2 Tax=Pseudanabaena sp. UWO311 TaxID=2487337 RepID=UPI0011591D9E|nr:DUF3592 domain-containing protein [Pseudanabaena sp. UWO311]TYQ25933.1 DUF3592 domain-containing protein [Pseudanabaena sp. UWO311]
MQLSPQIAGLICIVIGLGSAFYLLWTLRQQHMSKHWYTTTGEILESNIEEDSDGWYPHVRYEYTVQRKRYASERLYFYAVNGSTKRDAMKHLSPYAVGKTVTIYYDPVKPEEAVLNRHVPLWRHFFLLFCASFLLIGGATMLLG